MHNHHSRTVRVVKSTLISKIEENKAAHIKDYEEAVVAYRVEAEKQLKSLGKQLKEGKLNLKLNLVTPVDRRSDYDKVIEMFNWEVNKEVELTQQEFNEYVHDETTSAIHAKSLNSTYRNY